MDYPIGIVLALVLTLGIVGVVGLYLFNFTTQITGEYDVKSDVRLFEREGISIIKVIYTNSGGTDIIGYCISIEGCEQGGGFRDKPEPNEDGTRTLHPHSTGTFKEIYKGKDLRGKAVTLEYTFEDGTVVSHIYPLR